LNIVVIKDPKRNSPMILLTNQEINLNNADEILKIYNQYLERWKCEEVIRHIKQEYGLEDIRYQKLQNIKSVIALMVYADSFFLEQSVLYQKFTNRSSVIISKFYNSQDIVDYIDSFSGKIKKEIVRDFHRWNLKLNDWTNDIEVLKNFAKKNQTIL